MARFLIEVQHEPEALACANIVKLFLTTGSHLLAQADWGCMDGNHSAWLIVDVESKEEALQIVPPALRPQARIIGLNKFSVDQINELIRKHAAS